MNFSTSSEAEKTARLHSACSLAWRTLLAAREKSGHWVGQLSSSALSTATAVCAFAVSNRHAISPNSKHGDLIEAGLNWLGQNQNADGGWGDTPCSLSNISTTALGWSAFGAVPGADSRYANVVNAAKNWLAQSAGGTSSEALISAIEKCYGKDRTFSVPILMTCVVGNRFETGAPGWKRVRPLPFELAALPHQIYGALQLPVVSYALPALIAIGQARFHHRPTRNPVTFFARKWTQDRTLKILTKIQPENGGFLEAIPLTSFVAMSLASMQLAQHPVATKAFQFLENSVRPDGSWAIDTNLATWLTTLSIQALSSASPNASLNQNDRSILAEFLLKQQFKTEHPYTHSKPGGWAWTDLPGGVPDADDTAGALLALFHLRKTENEFLEAASAGLEWLLELQNRDGGIPTFCRGWSALPFDRSGADLTAHATRAWLAWRPYVNLVLQGPIQKAIERSIQFLTKAQRHDSAWAPLWFGNQQVPSEENLTYGTSRVLLALADLQHHGYAVSTQLISGVQWLLLTQNGDGGWGGALNVPSSAEETALAIEGLATCSTQFPQDLQIALNDSLEKGTQWLIEKIESGRWLQPSPIGFYFAKLWYHERLYPMIFTVAALGRTLRRKKLAIAEPTSDA